MVMRGMINEKSMMCWHEKVLKMGFLWIQNRNPDLMVPLRSVSLMVLVFRFLMGSNQILIWMTSGLFQLI